MQINLTNQTATAPTTAADYLTTKDDGFPKEENGRIYADAYDLIGTEIACTKNHSGNKTLHKMGRGRLAIHRECAGCGAIYTLEQLAKTL
jgi:hypothetical protein